MQICREILEMSEENISLCQNCYCMTKTIDKKCGKCGSVKCKKHKFGEPYSSQGGGIGIRTFKKCINCNYIKDITNYSEW